MEVDVELERKFARFDEGLSLREGAVLEGYASLFGRCDQGGDIVCEGAYAGSLSKLNKAGRAIKMLWQHDPAQPIGIWEEVREDARGLWVKGRLLTEVSKGREAAALIAAGAIDGLSIGYRTLRAAQNDKGQRLLKELELWEVSLVTFPMLPDARVGAKSGDAPEAALMREMADLFEQARQTLSGADAG